MDLKWVRRRVTEALLVSGAVVACLVNHHVPQPYMDEIFHVPQTQQYCRGDLLTWHPLITTLPGLYYLALGYVGLQYALLYVLGIEKAAAYVASTSDAMSGATSAGVPFASFCSPFMLRSLNLLLLVLSFPLFHSTARAAARAAAGAAATARSKKGSKTSSRSRGVSALLHRYETLYDTRKETRDDTGDGTGDDTGDGTGDDTGDGTQDDTTNNGQADAQNRPARTSWDAVDEDCTWRAAMFVLFPLHWFFGFLYYTDVASSVAVLAMMRCVYKRQHYLAALLATGSIFIRQTNAVWAFFALCVSASRFLGLPTQVSQKAEGREGRCSAEALQNAEKKEGCEGMSSAFESAQRLAARTSERTEGSEGSEGSEGKSSELALSSNDNSTGRKGRTFSDPSWATDAAARGEDVPRALLLLLHRAWAERWKFLRTFLPLLAVLAAFFIFVRVNGGIVVGARTEHRLSPHLMQPLYFAAFSALSLSPLLLAPSSLLPLLASTSRSLRSYPSRCLFLTLLVSSLLFLTIKNFSLAHPYLLADNRHHTFYIWRRLVQPAHNPSQRFLLLPLYGLSLLALSHALRRTMTPLGLFFFAAATAAVLVPSPLLEFRYFIPPFMLLLLHFPLPQKLLEKRIACTLVLIAFVAVDTVTMALFLFRPFKWEGEEGWQRFLW
ncbi:hypothetical protein CLOM_g17096 [Closterium sp. NIES-68]|nr:hypothetical protein CLOM_g17096 [Closterium sp. NIES-68]